MRRALRVLVLEDRPADAELVVRELRRHGFDVDWSRTETEAGFVAALENGPDVILADYSLPQFDALTALRLTLERRPHVPFIVVTGSVGEEAAVECLRLGAVDYFLKDRLARLGDAVERALEKERLREEGERAQAGLAEQAKLLESFFRHSQTCLVLLDRNFNFIRVNDAYAKACGRPASDFPGRNHFDIYPSEELRREFEDVVRTRKVFNVFRRPFSFPDHPEWGVSYWHLALAPILNDGGEVELLVFSLHDVTEPVRAEEELRRSEEKYRLFFEKDLAGHFISTPDGRLLACNPAFARTFGFSSVAEALTVEMSKLYPAPAARERFLELVRSRRSLERLELEMRRKDGRPVHVLQNAVGTFDEQGSLTEIHGFFLDETKRRETEQELRQAQKMEAVGRLAGGVAHDFNNVLTIILGYLELLEPSFSANDPRKAQIEEIRHAAGRAAGLTRQLLAFSRRQVLQPAVLDLNVVVADLEKMLRRLIGEDVRLETRLDTAAGRVMADPGQMEQVLLNLAINARDAMPEGGTLAITTAGADADRVRTDSGEEVSGPFVVLSVEDTGCGMSARTMAHIFEPFFTTKEAGKGTGLGLATVYGIVKQSGGFIRVESEPGRGTAFRIYLPRCAEPCGERAEAREESPAVEPASGTILLAEDDPALRAMTRSILSGAGFNVLAASSSEEAVALAGSHPGPIHMLLTDVVMPGMNGPELARAVAGRRPAAAVLFMSGYPNGGGSSELLVKPGVAFIQKPFTPSGLLQKVMGTLAKAALLPV